MKARMVVRLTCAAFALRKTLDRLATPCPVKTEGGYRRPPWELEVLDWKLKLSDLPLES
jgi:hypothetical protein